ncbi:hypothetical protein AV521_02170 [Streptomyces sp. IMTB 2501]|nr:hypothetical protein AV521_02170 [Streptomyces sp. IMTB 2501]
MVVFPLQAVIALDTYGTDYTDGEFLMVEQRPRARSHPWPPRTRPSRLVRRGDAARSEHRTFREAPHPGAGLPRRRVNGRLGAGVTPPAG